VNPLVTIVMYHYVRPLAGSHYPNIKGLESASFERQLDYLARHHHFVTTRQVIESVRGGPPLPAAPVLLTFDDGYADHYDHVFPALRSRGISGAFFPPSCTVLERKVLDVNKIHFILATSRAEDLVRIIDERVNEHRASMQLDSTESYRARFHAANRFDNADVIYVKRMLQRGLPEELRHRITDELFRRYVSSDEQSFASDLYVDLTDLQEMADAGMEIGSHGYAHHWLDSLDAQAQQADIDQSLRLLDHLGLPRADFLFCFPYGAYDTTTLGILQARGCGAAFTTRVGLAMPTPSTLLTLSRLDTNDLPTDAAAEPNHWTLEATAPRAHRT
jgi:peptidoglycan/xylan/chitin deacetylase (PgdA/CDA1 family)